MTEAITKAVDALEPFASIAEWDISDNEADSDLYRPMSARYAVGGLIKITALQEQPEREEAEERADAWKDQALEWEARATAAEAEAAAARKRVRELEAALHRIAGGTNYADDPWDIARFALGRQS